MNWINSFGFSKKAALCISFLFALTMQLFAQSFQLGKHLQSDMVIQQNKPLKVWGEAAENTTIEVMASWTGKWNKTTTPASGEWLIELPVPAAVPGDAQPQSITIKSGSTEKTLTNILIGDVWICSGQSNMDMELRPTLPWLLGVNSYQQEINNAFYPAIRLYDVKTDFAATPNRNAEGYWSICSPTTVADYSAVAYFFARDIYLQQRIPIGMVVTSLGASAAQAWTSRDTLAADPELNKKYLYPYDTSAVAKEKLNPIVTFEKVLRPTLLYNAMVYPLRNIGAKGILWYQGESNRFDGPLYTQLLSAMIRNWRTLLQQNDLPFYFVQVAPFKWENDTPDAFYYAELREAMGKVRERVPATEMVVTMDIADPTDIHPRNKQDVGYRLAQIALAKDYGRTGKQYKGPQYESLSFDKDTVIVNFKKETIGTGLATNDGQAPRHFYVAGKDKKFYPATAIIKNNMLYLVSDKVKKPSAVRYAFTNYPVTNFGNREGFPAEPFRSSF